VVLTNGTEIKLLTGYAAADGSVRSRVVAKLKTFVSVEALGFSNGLVIGTQPNVHGEGGVGAFGLRPDTGDVVWSGSGGEVTAITPDVTLEVNFRSAPNLIAYDTSSGLVRWQSTVPTNEPVHAVAGDLMYGFNVVNGAFELSVRRLAGGALVKSVPTDRGEITPSGGHVYLVTGTQLRAFAPS
jgi:hypothetical protein